MSGSAAEFSEQLKGFGELTKARRKLLFRRVVEHVGRSIRFGSPTTGAPGQPVKSGDLLKSWRQEGDADSGRVTWISNLYYAPIIEDNWRGATLRSPVGGFHSVKLTVAGYGAIIDEELKFVKKAVRAPKGRGSQMRDPGTGRFV